MATFEIPAAIAGAQELHDWFGYWPSFHDSEIVSLHLNRTNPSALKIHSWHTTSEVDEAGYYVQTKHAVIEFLIETFGVVPDRSLWEELIEKTKSLFTKYKTW